MNLIFRIPVTRFHGTSGLKCASITNTIFPFQIRKGRGKGAGRHFHRTCFPISFFLTFTVRSSKSNYRDTVQNERVLDEERAVYMYIQTLLDFVESLISDVPECG